MTWKVLLRDVLSLPSILCIARPTDPPKRFNLQQRSWAASSAANWPWVPRYTFLMEALCNEMPNEVKTKAIVLLKTAILGIKAEKRYMCPEQGKKKITLVSVNGMEMVTKIE